MARNKKVKNNPNYKSSKTTISARLDIPSLKLWNKMKVSRNMSKWLRDQLLYHFGGQLSTEQIRSCMREEVAILNKRKDERIREVELEINSQVERIIELYSTFLEAREVEDDTKYLSKGAYQHD